jgi:REP element-mobilizing transposase RayT
MDQIQAEEGFQLLAYVIMPDHLHLVVSLPAHLTTTRVMKMIKGRFARLYNERAGVRSPFWTGPVPRGGAAKRGAALDGNPVCRP